MHNVGVTKYAHKFVDQTLCRITHWSYYLLIKLNEVQNSSTLRSYKGRLEHDGKPINKTKLSQIIIITEQNLINIAVISSNALYY